jgi:hypothetical protein
MAWMVGTSMSTATSTSVGLVGGAGTTVKDETAGPGIGLGQTLGHHLHDEVVAQQLT